MKNSKNNTKKIERTLTKNKEGKQGQQREEKV